MDSIQSAVQGMQLYHQLSALLSKAGMHARKWLSNSSEVRGEITLEDPNADVDLDCVPKLSGYGGVQIQTSSHLEKTFQRRTCHTQRGIFWRKLQVSLIKIVFCLLT